MTRIRARAKKGTLSWWKQEFWKVFSVFIRLRDKGECYTCGMKKHWRQMQAGHMVPKATGNVLYFDETNVHCQCYYCNINLGGNGAVYAQRFIKQYGKKKFDTLMSKIHNEKIYTIPEYQKLIKKYKKKSDKLLLQYELYEN